MKSGISQQFGDKFGTFSTSKEAAIFIVEKSETEIILDLKPGLLLEICMTMTHNSCETGVP